MQSSRAPRNTLTRAKVVDAALAFVQERGLGELTIRALAQQLGVRPMSLYTHVASKDDIVDALVDAMFARIYAPDPSGEWRTELASRARSARHVLAPNAWALTVIESRTSPGSATVEAHEAVLELLARNGFDLAARAHVYAVLDAFVYGFVLQEAMLASAGVSADVDSLPVLPLARAPRIAELAAAYGEGMTFGASFDVGLDLILDGIEGLRDRD
ncbi:MAG: TetR/AcrR family transcriptional regulator C-terminal domain-containing protein [Mobilicoccus sp.]|nr:TetR/AcrR family transcriptional regulator C-terminal domain-containing protein [Mobilicoccus sp.]